MLSGPKDHPKIYLKKQCQCISADTSIAQILALDAIRAIRMVGFDGSKTFFEEFCTNARDYSWE